MSPVRSSVSSSRRRAYAPAMPDEQKRRWAGELPDLILGGQDGLVNVLGLVLGLAAATDSSRIIVVGALAAGLAESISMGAVAYTSRVAESDYYDAELARQRREVRERPEEKRRQLREALATYLTGGVLEQALSHLTADEDRWAQALMRNAFQVSRPRRTGIGRAVIVGLSTGVGSLIPLVPFLVMAPAPAAIVAVIVSALALFGVGAYKARTLIGDWRRSGLQLMLIGLCAAFAGYLIGVILRP
jgi:VIT1/CCC1 family predicted Fe2+/Mn2+ transporter